MSDSPDLLVERDGHVLVLTMNRPKAKNALSLDMLDQMSSAWDEINGNDDIRVAVLTGAEGNFCAGADLKAMNKKPVDQQYEETEHDPAYIKPLLKGFYLKKPLIAAVEGFAIAGGSEILQATDIRVAGESAVFGVAEVKLGLFPLGASTVRLRRQIPYTVAADMLLTGRTMTAEEAQRYGLIGHVTPDGQALDKALEIANRIARNGPVAVQAILQALRETECLPEKEALPIEAKIGMRVFMSEDAKEGPRAFAEKRKPEFKGR
ncbi:MAG: crotonase/enoyl-CoA hydratase family protein [Myxococcales bacterium]|nr:crotonase/enoyl-CoA hydratase family protein [Myxococcales bacterium]MDH3845986.1 crotonase/enoyl-CoA hydratase family protein [Myxococcales bacterium]